jgi:hypothetical protein
MGKCLLCNEEKDTRRLFMGGARGFANLCFDCTIRFFKIEKES